MVLFLPLGRVVLVVLLLVVVLVVQVVLVSLVVLVLLSLVLHHVCGIQVMQSYVP